MMSSRLLVSVAVVTYGHSKYIRQALDSILMQKTEFDYEIIVGDDCSQDDTTKILKEYEKQYPSIFKMLYREKNLGATKNFYDVMLHCSAKYIAILEGDDYWNDSYKMQKQVKFLEENPNFIGVVHSCNVISDNFTVSAQKEEMYRCLDGSIFTFEDFKNTRVPGHVCTLLFRNIFKLSQSSYEIIYTADSVTGDRTINMLLLAQGDIYCMDEAMSTYRLVLKQGASNINSQYLGKNMLFHNWEYETALDEYCRKTFGKSFLTNEYIAKYWVNALLFRLMRNTYEDKVILKKFNRVLYKHPSLILCIFRLSLRRFTLRFRLSKRCK